MIPRKTQISSPVIHIQRNFSLIPSLLSLSAAQVKQIYKWLRFGASTHFVPVHRPKGSARTQVKVFQTSQARSSCPPPESCHAPGSCYPALKASPRAGKTTEWVCSLTENCSYCTRGKRNGLF